MTHGLEGRCSIQLSYQGLPTSPIIKRDGTNKDRRSKRQNIDDDIKQHYLVPP